MAIEIATSSEGSKSWGHWPALEQNPVTMRLVTERLRQAQAALAVKADPEAPLTEEEVALHKMMSKGTEG